MTWACGHFLQGWWDCSTKTFCTVPSIRVIFHTLRQRPRREKVCSVPICPAQSALWPRGAGLWEGCFSAGTWVPPWVCTVYPTWKLDAILVPSVLWAFCPLSHQGWSWEVDTDLYCWVGWFCYHQSPWESTWFSWWGSGNMFHSDKQLPTRIFLAFVSDWLSWSDKCDLERREWPWLSHFIALGIGTLDENLCH